jgi:photosystem II stability/assembly factor-like uncharacterized protein
MRQVMLMIGTRKGAFLARSDGDRARWEVTGPLLKGAEVNHVTMLRGTGEKPMLAIASKTEWWGPDLRFSPDLGETWIEPSRAVRFAEDRGHSVSRVWAISEDRRGRAPSVYAGVDPGALFRSDDHGMTWDEVRSLTDHPTREKWSPGAGGLMVHSICHDPHEANRTYVGISAAGVFRTDDRGETWHPKNSGVRADFLPEPPPAVGHCVHHLVIHPTAADVLYQQNHCGVYRTENGGDTWEDISEGLPSRFGFPMAVHPHDGDTVYVVPEEADTMRTTTGGSFRVYRSRTRGKRWESLTNGLPQVNAHVNVLRMAMTTDALDPAGVYVGTQGGQVLVSRDEGDHWQVALAWLPPIYSLEVAALDD